MTDIPELTVEQSARAIPAHVRRRLVRGQFESGEDVAALRRFVGLSQARFARAMGISVHTLRNWEQGVDYTATGEYLTVERSRPVSYAYAMPQLSPNSDTITVEIAPEGDGCVVTFVQSGEDIANELRQVPPGGISGSEAGWQQGFDLVAAAWAKRAEPGAAPDPARDSGSGGS